MKRKEFIRQCVAVGIGCAGLVTLGLQSCATLPLVRARQREHELEVPLTALSSGSVWSVRTDNPAIPAILIRRRDDGQLVALPLKCTHQGCELAYEGTVLSCPCHGSEFSLDGHVLSPPAMVDLAQWETRRDDTNLYIIIRN